MKAIFSKTCLLDTNVLVAFINASHPHHGKAVELFSFLQEEKFQGVITSQNVLELTAVLVHGFKKDRKIVAEDVRMFTSDKLLTVLYPSEEVLTQFFTLVRDVPRVHVSDLFLLATAISHKVDVVVSADRQFIQMAKHLIPFYNPFV